MIGLGERGKQSEISAPPLPALPEKHSGSRPFCTHTPRYDDTIVLMNLFIPVTKEVFLFS